MALMLHCHYLKESLHVNFSRKALQYIGDFGMVGFVSGSALTLFYLFLEIYYKAGEYCQKMFEEVKHAGASPDGRLSHDLGVISDN